MEPKNLVPALHAASHISPKIRFVAVSGDRCRFWTLWLTPRTRRAGQWAVGRVPPRPISGLGSPRMHGKRGDYLRRVLGSMT